MQNSSAPSTSLLNPPSFPLPNHSNPTSSSTFVSTSSSIAARPLPPPPDPAARPRISAFLSSASTLPAPLPPPPTGPTHPRPPFPSAAATASPLLPPASLAWPQPPAASHQQSAPVHDKEGNPGHEALKGPATSNKKIPPPFGATPVCPPAEPEARRDVHEGRHEDPTGLVAPGPMPSATSAVSASPPSHAQPTPGPQQRHQAEEPLPGDHISNEHDDVAHMLCSLAGGSPAAFPSASPPEAAHDQLASPPPNEWSSSAAGASAGDSGDGLSDDKKPDLGGKAKKELKQTKRAQQNRAAQRAFRERKQMQIRELETVASTLPVLRSSLTTAQARIAQLEAEKQGWAVEREQLRREVEGLRSALGVETATGMRGGLVRGREKGEEEGGAKRVREG
ncbi:hypothetical protein JCM11641_008154 [Rhodosporidiobolus odoratus]